MTVLIKTVLINGKMILHYVYLTNVSKIRFMLDIVKHANVLQKGRLVILSKNMIGSHDFTQIHEFNLCTILYIINFKHKTKKTFNLC